MAEHAEQHGRPRERSWETSQPPPTAFEDELRRQLREHAQQSRRPLSELVEELLTRARTAERDARIAARRAANAERLAVVAIAIAVVALVAALV